MPKIVGFIIVLIPFVMLFRVLHEGALFFGKHGEKSDMWVVLAAAGFSSVILTIVFYSLWVLD